MLLFESSVTAGFPSPAEGAANERLSLDQALITHPEATFFMKMEGSAMERFGLYSGDTLVVDRAVTPRIGSTVVVCLDGEWLVRRLARRINAWCLESGEGLIVLDESLETLVWGVVTHSVHSLI